MTTYRQINVTDSWRPGEVHASRLNDTFWCLEAKLSNGRIARLFKTMPTPILEDEPALLRQLMAQDRCDRVREWLGRFWAILNRCYGCRCDR